jgi:hypothetical protein
VSTIVGVTRASQLPDPRGRRFTLSADVMKKIDAVTKEILYPWDDVSVKPKVEHRGPAM